MSHDLHHSGPTRRLERDDTDRKIAGVCSGIARYAGIDPVLVRLLFIGGAVLGLSTVVLYVAAWILMPVAAPPVPAADAAAPAAPTPPTADGPVDPYPGPVDHVA